MNASAVRRALTLVTASALALGMAACSASPSEEDPTGAAGGGGGGDADGYYPHTMDTLYGDVTIEEAPERVVALWRPIASDLLALGITPYGPAVDPETVDENYPWLSEGSDTYEEADMVAEGELQVEAIAALEPDLIIGANYQLQDEALFEQLNAIAPTIVPNTDSQNVDWDARLLYSAEAIDAVDEAETVIADLQAEFAAVGDTVPGIEDKTYNWVSFGADYGGYGFGNGAVLELFGLQPADSQDNSNTVTISQENAAELDADLLTVWPIADSDREILDGDALFQALPAVQNGDVYYAPLAVANALNAPDPYSMRWFLEEITPAVEHLGQ